MDDDGLEQQRAAYLANMLILYRNMQQQNLPLTREQVREIDREMQHDRGGQERTITRSP
jgi:hypothetical protein